MGTPIVAFQKDINQCDQSTADPSSGDTNNSSAEARAVAGVDAGSESKSKSESGSASGSESGSTLAPVAIVHHRRATPNSNSSASQSASSPIDPAFTIQAAPRAHQHQPPFNHQQLQRYSCSSIASQHQFYPAQQQAIRFPNPHQPLAPTTQLVYPAPPAHPAHIIEACNHLQSPVAHLNPIGIGAPLAYSHHLPPATAPLLAHALPLPAESHALYSAAPTTAASYYIPVGPQPTFYTAAHASAPQATTQTHHHPALLATVSLPVPGHTNQQPQLQQCYDITNGSNLLHNASPDRPAEVSSSVQSSSSASSMSHAAAATEASAQSAYQKQTSSAANLDEEQPIASAKGRFSAITAHDSPTITGTWASSFGYQQSLTVQPPAYYLTPTAAAAAHTAPTPAGFLLMSAYPLFPQANYHATDHLIHHHQQQQHYHQQSSLAAQYHQQFYTNPTMGTSVHQQPAPVYASPVAAFGQFKPDYDLAALLPIDAQPTQTRQAYGMDKVWQDEFECLFSQFISSNVVWTLAEVETNPSLMESDKIIAYSGRYIIRAKSADSRAADGSDICCAGCELTTSESNANCEHQAELKKLEVVEEDRSGQQARGENDQCSSDQFQDREAEKVSSSDSVDSGEADLKSVESEFDIETNRDDEKQQVIEDCQLADSVKLEQANKEAEQQDGGSDDSGENIIFDSETMQEQERPKNVAAEIESDCDSGTQVNSNDDISGSSSCSSSGSHSDQQMTSATTETNSETSRNLSASSNPQHSQPSEEATCLDESGPVEGQPVARGQRREFLRRFRMFIDSAKVRFCCDHCGHGWTSMKGRVVFWYELFEVVDLPPDDQHPPVALGLGGGRMIGYCAYKLFGQQCDVCKIENRFERPMWYPEEVTKVLNNLYNKIGQVYFGFKMPAIDKQRRAGKPKTSHNSSLCQACHDGVCTDRK